MNPQKRLKNPMIARKMTNSTERAVKTKVLNNQPHLRENKDPDTRLGLRRMRMVKRTCTVMKLLMKEMKPWL